MSTSPTSELTVLLWGRRWWLPGRAQPLDFENLTHAAVLLTAHLGGQVRLRLIYQPESLVSVAAACPRGPRPALQAALGDEHPAILDASLAWGHEPILAEGDAFGTFLHYEREPGLFALVERLGARGIVVTSAWPLATFLHALPDEWSDSGAVLVLAADDGQALAYHHPEGGVRHVRQWQGAAAKEEALAWLAQEKSRAEVPSLLLLAGEVAVAEGVWPLTEALGRAVILPRAHPAQLLPAESLFSAQRLMVAASVVLLLAAGWSGAAYARDFQAWDGRRQVEAREKSALRAEIEHFRVNAAEIVTLKARLAGPGTSLPAGELLDAVGAELPPQLALDRIRVAQGRFTLAGHVAPGATAEWERWRARLAGKRWTLEPSAPRENGAFNLQGTFNP